MSIQDGIRAWKESSYRESLSKGDPVISRFTEMALSN